MLVILTRDVLGRNLIVAAVSRLTRQFKEPVHEGAGLICRAVSEETKKSKKAVDTKSDSP
jgi:hypothetical protein